MGAAFGIGLVLLLALFGVSSVVPDPAPGPKPEPLPVPPGPVPVPPPPVPPNPEPGPSPAPFNDSDWFQPSQGWKCSLTGEGVPTVSPGHVVAAIAILGVGGAQGVPTDTPSATAWLQSPNGILQIKIWQALARSLGLGGMKGASSAWIDGKVGGCTLSSIRAALALRRAGQWNPPPMSQPMQLAPQRKGTY